MGKRLFWADALRGLLIIIVVLGHSLQHGDYENRLSWNIIYSFHMAAFFVISGYVGYKESYNISSLIGKTRQLLLPFISWTIVETIINETDFSRLGSVLLHPDTSYWFVYVLFIILSIFMLIMSFSKKTGLNSDYLLVGGVTLLILIMVITEFRLLGFQFISLYFGFYVLGYMLRKYKIQFSLFSCIILGIIWFCFALFWRMHTVPFPLQCAQTFLPPSLITYGYRYITAFVGSLFFVGLAIKCMNSNNGICRILSYFGKISLGIYIIHLFLDKYVDSIYIHYFPSETCFSYVIFDFLLKLGVSYLLVQIIKKIPIVSLLLLGKKI